MKMKLSLVIMLSIIAFILIEALLTIFAVTNIGWKISLLVIEAIQLVTCIAIVLNE